MSFTGVASFFLPPRFLGWLGLRLLQAEEGGSLDNPLGYLYEDGLCQSVGFIYRAVVTMIKERLFVEHDLTNVCLVLRCRYFVG